MTNENPPLVLGEEDEGILVAPVKKLLIQSLRATFTSAYPNTKLANMNLNIEYPYKNEQYPGIWVKFSPHRVQASGLDPTHRSDDEIFVVWYFEGTVTLMIFALTSKERDLISDGFLEAFAFGSVMPSASPFHSTMLASDLINMTPQSDTLTAGGQTESVGLLWDDDKLVYQDNYSFELVGQVRSRIQSGVVFTELSEVQVANTLTNVEGAPDNSIDDDGNGTWY